MEYSQLLGAIYRVRTIRARMGSSRLPITCPMLRSALKTTSEPPGRVADGDEVAVAPWPGTVADSNGSTRTLANRDVCHF